MKKSRILLDFDQYSDGNFEALALGIAAAMKGNANFETPSPSLDELNAAVQRYSDALAAAKTRDKVKILIKKDMRGAMDAVLRSLAHYVSFVADGDRSIMASAGFPMNALMAATVQLGTADNFTVRVGESQGTATLSVNHVSGRKTYMYFWAPAPVVNNAWVHCVNGYPKFTVTGLEPLKAYSFRIGITGSKARLCIRRSLRRWWCRCVQHCATGCTDSYSHSSPAELG